MKKAIQLMIQLKHQKKIEALGVSLINVSSGSFDGIPFDPYPLYQVKLAHAIKQHVSIPVATAGLISTLDEIESIFEKDQADVVLLGRKALVDPYFVVKEKFKAGLIEKEDVKNYMYRGLLTIK